MKINNKTKTILLSVIGLLILVLSFAYAYMTSFIDEESRTRVEITGNTLDDLSFQIGDSINIIINQETLSRGGDNLTASTSSSAKLVANDKTSSATSTYDVSFDIKSNGFFHTTEEKTPEIILSIKDHNNNEITSIQGYTYITVGDISGFDITDSEGKITIKRGEEISTTSTTTGTTHVWTATITFINLPSNQSAIEGKLMDANLVIEGFQTPRFYETVLADKGGATAIIQKTAPNFNLTATTNEGMFAAEDDYGTSYYFRGAVDNNWVKCGKIGGNDIWWRIVRINGDNSVRLIYSGTSAPTSGESVRKTGAGTQTGVSAFVTVYNKAEYTGYMYQSGVHRGFTNNTSIKASVDNWYNNNLKTYEEYLQDNYFCNDRSAYSNTSGTVEATPIGLPSSGSWYFGSYVRLNTKKTPTLKCPSKDDAFTKVSTSKGNAKLINPIGLLTADEVMMAGGKFNTINASFYLNTNQNYWLATPYQTTTTESYSLYVFTSGHVYSNTLADTFGVRPVISLKPDLIATGNGTYNNPYIPVFE